MLFGAALVVVPAAPAAAAPPAGATVDIQASQVELLADGTVRVPIRVRCSAVDAFEVGVGVTRAAPSAGSPSSAGVPACTGKWQQTSFVVTAESGTFLPGPATVGAYVAAYDRRRTRTSSWRTPPRCGCADRGSRPGRRRVRIGGCDRDRRRRVRARSRSGTTPGRPARALARRHVLVELRRRGGRRDDGPAGACWRRATRRSTTSRPRTSRAGVAAAVAGAVVLRVEGRGRRTATVDVGGRLAADAAWSYPRPTRGLRADGRRTSPSTPARMDECLVDGERGASRRPAASTAAGSRTTWSARSRASRAPPAGRRRRAPAAPPSRI